MGNEANDRIKTCLCTEERHNHTWIKADSPRWIQDYSQDFILCWLWSHRMLGVEGPLGTAEIQPLSPWTGTPYTEPGCSKPHPVWPWSTLRPFHNLSEQPVPVPHHSLSKDFLPNIKSKPGFCQFKSHYPLSWWGSKENTPAVCTEIWKSVSVFSWVRHVAPSVAVTLSSATPCNPSWCWCPRRCGASQSPHRKCTLS